MLKFNILWVQTTSKCAPLSRSVGTIKMIDIHTIVAVLGVSSLLQLVVLFVQYRLDRSHQGSGWWASGALATAVAFVFHYLRDHPVLGATAIVLNNAFFIIGLELIFVGVLRFLGRREKPVRLALFCAVFTLIAAYFILVQDNNYVRTVNLTFAIAVISAATARSLSRPHPQIPSIKPAANFLAWVFRFHAFVFFSNVIYFLLIDAGGMFTPSLNRMLVYMVVLIDSTLWTFGFIILVNQRLQAEMRTAKDNAELLFQARPDTVIITRMSDGVIEDVNEGFTLMTGYRREESIGQSILALHLWQNPDESLIFTNEIKANGFCDNQECIFRLKDGTRLYGLVSARVVQLHGSPRIISVVRDISERRLMESALKESNARYEELTRRIPVGIYTIRVGADGGYRVEYVSQKLCQLMGVQRYAVLANAEALFGVIHPEDRPLLDETNRRAGQTLDRFSWDGRFILHNEVRWMKAESNPVPLPNGDSLWNGVIIDITESKLAAQALQTSETMLREVSQVAKVGGWSLDLASGELALTEETLRIHEIGPDVRLSLDTAMGFYPDEVKPKIRKVLNRAVREGIPYDMEVPFVSAKGKRLWVRIIARTDQRNEGRGRLYGVFQDITKRKETERLLQLARFGMDQAVDEVYYINSDGGFEYVNEAACRKLGYSREELLTMTVLDMDPLFERERWRQHWQTLKSSGSLTFETLHRPRNGPPYPVEVHVNLVEIEGQVYTCSVCRDITERKRMEQELRESEFRWKFAIEGGGDGVWDWNAETDEVTYSKLWKSMLGYAEDDILPSNDEWKNRIHPADQDYVATTMQAYLNHKIDNYLVEYRLRCKDDSYKWILGRGMAVNHAEDGRVLRMIGTHSDITKRKQAESKLRETNAYLENLLDYANAPIIVWDAHLRITRFNHAFETLTGLSEAEVLGQSMELLFPPEWVEDSMALIRKTVTGEHWKAVEIKILQRNGEVRTVLWNSATLFAEDGQTPLATIAQGLDITERKRFEEEIKQLAFFDPLTQLPNRRLLQDRLRQNLASSDRSRRHQALLFIDLDNFKTLNDTLGHDMGDLLLLEVAQRLSACVRRCDTVARLGGDEFVVMLTDLDADPSKAIVQTQTIGKKTLDALDQLYLLDGHEHHCSASMGITLYVGQANPVEELLKQADIALYQAKAAGRNTLRFFDNEMQSVINSRAAMTHDLRYALGKNQFLLYFQAAVNAENKAIAFEALLRWQHPERGLVMPSDFIPLAEETGLIHAIGDWVLESSCALLRSWQSEPERQGLQLAVNISVRQFHQPQFVEGVMRMLQDYQIEPNRLILELTESVVLADINDAMQKMYALKQAGLRLSLDDFGTGYSSLAYLTQLPFDQLKIDQSFVRNIDIIPNDAIIVRTIIAMAKQLGLDIVAEGVETAAQREFLIEQGCPVCQGYLFGKPVPVEQFSF